VSRYLFVIADLFLFHITVVLVIVQIALFLIWIIALLKSLPYLYSPLFSASPTQDVTIGIQVPTEQAGTIPGFAGPPSLSMLG
jgi:hypothetical protein